MSTEEDLSKAIAIPEWPGYEPPAGLDAHQADRWLTLVLLYRAMGGDLQWARRAAEGQL